MDMQGFGNGQDGVATLSGTDAPKDSTCSGTSGTTALAAPDTSFTADKMVFIHQSQGSGVGNWELNLVESYAAGAIETVFPLVNSYATGAQVIEVKEYSSVVVSATFTAKAWDGSKGGIIVYLCNGETNINGVMTATGTGFRGANSASGSNIAGYRGEGYTGNAQDSQQGAQGNGAGAPGVPKSFGYSRGGSGGGNAEGGAVGSGDDSGGNGGGTSGQADLLNAVFGGGGSSGSINNTTATSGSGGRGGGLIFIWTRTLIVTGTLSSDGANGGNGSADAGGGGGGAAGCIYVICESATYGTNLIHCLGGVGGVAQGNAYDYRRGGVGSVGRVHISACERSGVSNPAADESIAGHAWCVVAGSIY